MWLALATLLLSDGANEVAPRHFAGLPIASFRTYTVEGRNAREVAASLEAQRPTLSDGSRGYAVTSWRLPTQWASDAFGRCSPSTVRISVEFDVTLPVLAREAELELKERERAKWHDYMDFLAAHEVRRIARVMAGARDLERRMRAADDCGPLDQMLGDGVRAIGADARALDAEVAEEFAKKPSTRRGFP